MEPTDVKPWKIWPWTNCPACESGVMYQPISGIFEGEERTDLAVDGEPWICVNPACRTHGTWTVTDNGAELDLDSQEVMDEAKWNALDRPVQIRVRVHGLEREAWKLYYYFERACVAGLCENVTSPPIKAGKVTNPVRSGSGVAAEIVVSDEPPPWELNTDPGYVHIRLGLDVNDFEVVSVGAGVIRDERVDARIERVQAHHRAFFEQPVELVDEIAKQVSETISTAHGAEVEAILCAEGCVQTPFDAVELVRDGRR